MAEEEVVEKTPLDKTRDILNQLKEMEHYARTNNEKLSGHWLQLDDELKIKDLAKQVEGLLSQQGAFHESLKAAIDSFEAHCNKQASPSA